MDDLPSTSISKPKVGSNKRRKRRESGSSDEERWLTAIESGKLEDVDDELKKIKPKDPSLMTARQRAIYDRGSEGGTQSIPTLMSLPTGYKEKVMTAEAIQKAAIKSQKRKQLADEKREKDKKKTMDRLLKKQDSKISKFPRNKTTKTSAPVISYKQNLNSTSLYFPENAFPLRCSEIQKVPIPKYCSMDCGNLRKYACSVTGNIILFRAPWYKDEDDEYNIFDEYEYFSYEGGNSGAADEGKTKNNESGDTSSNKIEDRKFSEEMDGEVDEKEEKKQDIELENIPSATNTKSAE